MKQIIFFLISISFAASFASNKGIVCTDDALPDGDKQDYTLKPNSDGTYNAYYQVQRGDMKDGVSDPSPEVALATGLTCTFGPTTPALADCSKEDATGDVVAYFNTELVNTTSVSNGKEYKHENYSISAKVEDLNQSGEYPDEMNKNGYVYTDIISGDCEDVE